MSDEAQTLFHAIYVAFAFACLFFGALAFRQVLDNLEVKRLKLGEDRDAFIHAPGVVFVFCFFMLAVLVGIVCYTIAPPSIYIYAFPLILGVQSVQMAMRLVFQRTQIKTKGIVVRSVLFDNVETIQYEDIVIVELHHALIWTTVTVRLSRPEPVMFRIFRFSAPALHRLINGASGCPVIQTGRGDHNDPPPVSTTV